MDPRFGSVGPDLSLPDRHLGLESIDQPPAGIERLVSVGAAYGDHDADLATIEMANSVHERGLDDRPEAARFNLALGHLLQGHVTVRLVIECDRAAIAGELTDRAQKRADRTRLRGADTLCHGSRVDRFGGDLDH